MGQIKILTKDQHEALSVERMEREADYAAYLTWKQIKNFLSDRSNVRELDEDFAREMIELAYTLMNSIEDELERREVEAETLSEGF